MVTRSVASSYSTGGGGTILEHRYGTILLAHLLTGDSISLLGNDFSPREVAFQCRAVSPVDDIVVTGWTADGQQRRLSIGIRRSPEFVPSHVKTVKLLEDYLAVVHDCWNDIAAGRWRLALAVAAPHRDVQWISRLASLARVFDEESFRDKVALSNAAMRTKLQLLDEMVVLAAEKIGAKVAARELTWRLLLSLWPVEIRVEGVDQRDRADTVSRLRSMTRAGTSSAAAELFRRLDELTGDYVPAGAVVTQAVLRRDLDGFSLVRSPCWPRGWSRLDRLATQLRDRTGSRLSAAGQELEIDRAETRAELRQELCAVGAETGVLIVRGDPDVGKSALTLRVAEELRAEPAGVVVLSLRDLPATMVEFEAVLGADPVEVLAGTPVEEVRLLLVDGAEAALEGRQTLLTDLATASLRAGLGVVAVTRSDGAGAVAGSLMSAQRAVGRVELRPAEYVVPPLDDYEVDQLVMAFGGLRRLSDDRRSAWVLSRPGLVDLLLRGDLAPALPDHALSEADVFAAIWQGLIRRSAGGAPDAREHTLMALARRQMFPGTISILSLDASALSSLRSDGLLLPSSWNCEVDFASDLVRDLAVARLLLADGWSVLGEAGGPRWALRAVRLACQATFLPAGVDSASHCVRLHQAFEAIAAEHGRRWAELPFEAMLTLGAAAEVLDRAWPVLSTAQRAMLVRLGMHGYTWDYVGDNSVLAPLVELSFREPPKANVYGRLDIDYHTGQLVLSWLRGISDEHDKTDAIRQAVRDAVLAAGPAGGDRFAVEVIALLGPDLNASAEEFLRGLAELDSGSLIPAFETHFAAWSMSRNKPALLFDLVGACCFETDRYRFRPESEVFLALLSSDASRALALIQRLLNLAAASHEVAGTELELEPGIRRLCKGDSQVWTWHDRDHICPDSCVAALGAIQMFAEYRIKSGTSLGEVSEFLLRDCENLAMPGFVVAFLMRHIVSVTDELDRWMVQPEVWDLERSRRALDSVSRGSEANLNKCDIGTAAAHLVVDAIVRRDQTRIADLKAIGLGLLNRVRGDGEPDDENKALVARSSRWVDILDAANYRLTLHEGEVSSVSFLPLQIEKQASIEKAELEPDLESRLFGVGMRYSGLGRLGVGAKIHEKVITNLPDDLALVRDAAGCSTGGRSIESVAIAAAVVAANRKIALADNDLRWVADYLMALPFASRNNLTVLDDNLGVALVALLHPAFFSADVDYRQLERSLAQQAKVPINGLAEAFGYWLESLWNVGCPEAGHCPHVAAWSAVEELLRERACEEWCATRLVATRLQGPLNEALREAPAKKLAIGDWPGIVVACIDAAHSSCCVADRARALLDVLLSAYGRAVQSRSTGFGPVPEGTDDDRRLAGALLVRAAHGDCAPLTRHLHALACNLKELEAFLRDLSCRATHDARVRRVLPKVWPLVMATVLDLRMPDGDQGRSVFAVLLPEPRVSREDPWRPVPSADLASLAEALGMAMADPDETLANARAQWIDPEALRDLIEQWIPMVQGNARAVGALVGLVRTAAVSWQVATGLRWVEKSIGDDYYQVALFSRDLLDWLADLHMSGQLTPQDATVWHRIVDALVAEGNERAVSLQRELE